MIISSVTMWVLVATSISGGTPLKLSEPISQVQCQQAKAANEGRASGKNYRFDCLPVPVVSPTKPVRPTVQVYEEAPRVPVSPKSGYIYNPPAYAPQVRENYRPPVAGVRHNTAGYDHAQAFYNHWTAPVNRSPYFNLEVQIRK